MVEEINHDRRRFLATAIMTIASAQFGIVGSAAAQSSKAKPASVPAIKPGANKSFGPLKQIDAGALKLAMPKRVQAVVLRLYFFMAGPTTFIASSMLPLCWLRRVTG